MAIDGEAVLISSGYGAGAELLNIQRADDGSFSAESLWKSRHLKAKFANMIAREGHVYSLDDGIMVCVDLKTGRRTWKDGRYGHGQMILAGDTLLVMAENGEAVQVRADPGAWEELGRFPALKGKTWNPPALAGEYFLARNDREAACYRVAITSGE